MTKIGAWLIGARGALAATVVTGTRAIVHGLSTPTGLVTELPDVAQLPLVSLDQIVFGGWDVVSHSILDRARDLASEHRSLPAGLVAALEDDLGAVDVRVREGLVDGGGPAARGLAGRPGRRRRESLCHAIQRLGDDLDQFRAQHRLETVVVVNVASTEPPCALRPEHEHLEALERLVQQEVRRAFPASAVYAYAALERGYPYVNFTPSLGVEPPALQQLGRKNGVPFYGRDGKTGETLVKSALAPVFRSRHLEVLSWDGFNLLGGGDGRVLEHPRHKRSKLESKSQVLPPLLGYAPHSRVAIEYVPSMGNWKTAWDHIHFQGFLGTKMTAQFIWQGCDSILAAPLVLDLVRLIEFAHRRGEAGPAAHLAFFFKNPMGVAVHNINDQFRLLLDYVERHMTAPRVRHR
jgi:myo-inositol-1-phosphate synthase